MYVSHCGVQLASNIHNFCVLLVATMMGNVTTKTASEEFF